MFEIQASTFNCVDGGDWTIVCKGKTIKQARENFGAYLENVPPIFRTFGNKSIIMIYDRYNQKFIERV